MPSLCSYLKFAFSCLVSVAIVSAAAVSAADRAPQQGDGATLPIGWHHQHFVCNTGYDRARCHQQVVMLSGVLRSFNAAIPENWTWVLVRQDDWHPLAIRVGLDPDSPAFTALERRETFLDEALFSPNAVTAAALMRSFLAPLDQMLELAVSHELGHAFCTERREMQADRFGEQLRKHGLAQCFTPPAKTTRDRLITFPVPK